MNNLVVVHGRVGKDPELRFSKAGNAVLELSIVDTYGKDTDKKSTWHNVVVFGKLAENTGATLNKGDMCIIVGRYEQDEYTKKDGTKGKTVKFIADEIGPSCRWNAWVADKSEATMAQVGQVTRQMPAPSRFEDEEPF